MSLKVSALLAVPFALVILGPLFTESAGPCADGSAGHTATPGEVRAGALPGRPVCPGDTKAGITNDAGAAKAYLQSIARDLRNSKAPPTSGGRIDKLNNAFATCAANFLKAYAQKYGPIFVVSAFRCGPRSPASIQCDRTENARARGATNSNHQIGMAMDVNPASGNYAQLHAFARASPQFGVGFPLGMGDRPHMQPTNMRSPSCSGVAGTPANTPPPQTSQTTPTSGITSGIRDWAQGSSAMNTAECFTSLNPPVIAPPGTVQQSQCLTNGQGQQPQLPPQPPAPQQPSPPPQMQQPQMPPQQQFPQQPQSSIQPALSTQPTLQAQPTLSTQPTVSSNLPIQSSPASLLTIPNSPISAGQNSILDLLTATSTTTGEPIALNLNSNDGSGAATGSLSAFYLIRQLENQMDPVNQPIMTTTTPLSLNNDLLNSVELQAAFPRALNAATGTDVYIPIDIGPSSDATAPENISGRIVYATATPATRPIIMAPSISQQQTFTSPDLGNAPVSANIPAAKQNDAVLIRILTIFRDTLLLALEYLKPFGSRAAVQI